MIRAPVVIRGLTIAACPAISVFTIECDDGIIAYSTETSRLYWLSIPRTRRAWGIGGDYG
jgi:hypothetical protein